MTLKPSRSTGCGAKAPFQSRASVICLCSCTCLGHVGLDPNADPYRLKSSSSWKADLGHPSGAGQARAPQCLCGAACMLMGRQTATFLPCPLIRTTDTSHVAQDFLHGLVSHMTPTLSKSCKMQLAHSKCSALINQDPLWSPFGDLTPSKALHALTSQLKLQQNDQFLRLLARFVSSAWAAEH